MRSAYDEHNTINFKYTSCAQNYLGSETTQHTDRMEELYKRGNGEGDNNDTDDSTVCSLSSFFIGSTDLTSAKILERIKNNSPKLTSIQLERDALLSLLESREMCEKLGSLIGSNTQLRSLNIDTDSEFYGAYDDDNLVNNYDIFLRGVANSKTITKLRLGLFCPDSSDAIEILAPIFENDSVSIISFGNCSGERIGLLTYYLTTHGHGKGTLGELSLRGTEEDAITDEDAANIIGAFKNHHRVEKLTLDYTILNEKTSSKLSDMLDNPSCRLKNLSLQFNEMNDNGFSIFANGLLGNGSLVNLDLTGSEYVSAEGWVNFFGILRSAKLGALHTIRLDSNNINDEGVAIFAEVFSNNNNLKKLYLSRNMSITTAGWQTLASLFLNRDSAIGTIDIINGNDSFDDDAAIAWANALSISKNAKLKDFLFSPWGVTSRGWLALENLVCNKTNIDALCDSNHTLSVIATSSGQGVSKEFASMMDLFGQFKISFDFERDLDHGVAVTAFRK